MSSTSRSSLPARLLIANRGEIAIRIAKTAAQLGIETVAICSPEDQGSRHIDCCNDSVTLNGRGVNAYLDVEQVISAALTTGCDAIHPGYGFLSESSIFAQRCSDEGLVFVGPTPSTLALFGDKARAREFAMAEDIPITKGTRGAASLPEIREFYKSLGPGEAIMIKAVSGGGGRGMRIVDKLDDLETTFERCESEAKAAFGNAQVYAEQFFRNARHIEVQIIGDGSGEVSHLWERECSLQRRNQKLVEIAPSPWISDKTRQKLTDYSIRMAKALNYRGLGTFEFLVSATDEDQVVFMEANPRLQVEHTVTEEIVGEDLVAAQLQIAGGASLPACKMNQADISTPRGYAIQWRINAETLLEDGQPRPATGIISRLELPSGPGVRVDHLTYTGYRPEPLFDSLIAKLICWCPGNFEQVLAKSAIALQAFVIDGLSTNLSFLNQLAAHPDIKNGDFNTHFIEQNLEDLLEAAPENHKQLRRAEPTAETESLRQTHEYADEPGTLLIQAPMAGAIVKVEVCSGDVVLPGDPLYIMESMKMEHNFNAKVGGTIRDVIKGNSDIIDEGDLILVIDLDEASIVSSQDNTEESAYRFDPTAWQTSLDELTQRTSYAQAMGGPERIERQHSFGKLTARERISAFVDADSFSEIMPLLGTVTYDDNNKISSFIPKTSIGGTCRIGGRKVCLQAGDYTVRGGAEPGFGGLGQEMSAAQQAVEWRVPYVRLIDGFGGSVNTFEKIGRTFLPDGNVFIEPEVQLLNIAPVASAVLGVAAGLPAVQIGLSHFSVMVKNTSQVFPGGPPVVKAALGVDVTKEELGGWKMHTMTSGVVDNVADTEFEAIEQVKQFLSYLPSNVWELPPQTSPEDPVDRSIDEVLSLVPHDNQEPYDMRKVIQTVVDKDSLFEIAPHYGKGRITALARVNGFPIGILANNSLYGGATGVAEGEKAIRMIKLCDTFHIPIVSFADEPGFKVGIESERMGIERAGSRLVTTVVQSQTPWITFVVGKLFGVGGQCHHRPTGMFKRYAWPTARWGSMHIEGGTAAAYRSEIEAADDPEAKLQEIEARLQALASPFRTAETTGQDIIDPRATRRLLAEFVKEARKVSASQLGHVSAGYLP